MPRIGKCEQIWGVPERAIKEDIHKLIYKLLKVPYKHRGRDLDGMDCWGLVVWLYKRYGVKVKDIGDYVENWAKNGGKFFDDGKKEWEKVEKMRILDVLLFKNKEGVCDHCGVYLWDGWFLHISKKGMGISKVERWRDKLDGAYRYNA